MSSSINIFQRLRDLVPLPQVYVGVVLEIHDDFTSTVQIPGPPITDYAGNVAVGSIMRPRGATVPVGHRAFVRAGVIETEAPDGDIADIEVGRVILPPPAAPPLTAIGWLEWVLDVAGVAAMANTGVTNYGGLLGTPDLYAGVVSYAGSTVAWGSVWAPLAGDAAPTLLALSGGVVQVSVPESGGMPSMGLLTLSATIDGVACPNTIELSLYNPGSSYAQAAWGPAP
jgi:hypothetical protein